MEDKQKNRHCDITSDFIADLLELQDYKCAVSGISLHRDKSLYSMSIDRIDNKWGHTKDNVQLIARGLNLAKNNGSQEDLIALLDNMVCPSFNPDDGNRSYISSRIRAHRRRDLKLGMICDINSDDILELYEATDGRCSFTGIKMACYAHPCFSISIDRINNSVGHVVGNVRLVLKSINRAKRNYNDDDFIVWLNDTKESYIRETHG